MRTFRLSKEEYTFSLTMAALTRLDQLRPGVDIDSLDSLTETTTGILDLAQAMSGIDRDQLAGTLIRNIVSLPLLRTTLLEEITEALRMETKTPDAQEEVDVVLEQMKTGGGLTYRRLTFMGLLSGLSLEEMMPLTPGAVSDLYIYRVRYDDEQHGIKRKKQMIYD